MKELNQKLFFTLIAFVVCFKSCGCQNDGAYYQVHYLSTPKERLNLDVKDPSDNLFVFCYAGEGRNWLNVWKSVGVHLHFQNDDYEVFQGANETEVEYSYRQSSSVFHFMPWKTKLIDFDVFKKSCVGVYSQLPFSVVLEVNCKS